VDLTRAAAEACDAEDPLAGFRDRFAGAGTDASDPTRPLYLDGNSLGRMPRATPAALARVVEEEWARGLVRSWSSWIGAATRVGDLLAEGVLGARPGEVLVGDSTTVDLYKLLVAAADARPGRDVLVCSADDFPTDRYVVAGVAQARGMTVREVPADPDEGLDPAVLARRWTSGSPSSSCRRSPTARGRWPTSPPSPAPRGTSVRWCCGTSRTPPARCRSTWPRTAPTSPSGAPTST